MEKETRHNRMIESTADELLDDLFAEMYEVWKLNEDEAPATVRAVLMRALEMMDEEEEDA